MDEGYIVDTPGDIPPARPAPAPAPAQRPTARKKVVRRDPEKRRLQNRLAQKTYREKQKKRVQELERRAANHGTAVDSDVPLTNECQLVARPAPGVADAPGRIHHDTQTVDPSHLRNDCAASSLGSTNTIEEDQEIEDQVILTHSFDQTLAEVDRDSVSPVIFFDCGCLVLHVPVGSQSTFLLPIIPDLRMNTLRIDIMCSIAAFIENCRQMGIARSLFCADEAVSPFYRPQIDAPAERDNLVNAVQRGFRGLHYDLRPTRNQIISNHHPYVDAIPFKDIRDNLITFMDVIDEDEFFHDSLSHLTCWGSVKGSFTGSPWDSRSWEASEPFLQKWWLIVGGEDGELTRQSRWWRSLRGETVIEVS